MTTFERILFPVDFSEQCRTILPAVKAMVKRFNSELTLLHVVGIPVAVYGTPEAAAWATEDGAAPMRAFQQIGIRGDRIDRVKETRTKIRGYFPVFQVTICRLNKSS